MHHSQQNQSPSVYTLMLSADPVPPTSNCLLQNPFQKSYCTFTYISLQSPLLTITMHHIYNPLQLFPTDLLTPTKSSANNHPTTLPPSLNSIPSPACSTSTYIQGHRKHFKSGAAQPYALRIVYRNSANILAKRLVLVFLMQE